MLQTAIELPRHIPLAPWIAKSRLLLDSSLKPAVGTRGERVIQFIETYCRVPEGKMIGQPIVLLYFQKLFILAIYDNPAGTAVAILSIARKNGKTALIAAIVLAHLVGPEARQNSQIVSGAQTRDQASIVFKLALKMVNLNPKLQKLVRPIPSTKTLIGLTMNTEYRALSAEGSSNHGLSPVLAIIDEMGQVKGDYDPFIEAIETAQGAYDDALEIIISTQAPTDGDMLSIRIDDAIRSQDPTTVCHVYSADFYAADKDIKPEEVAVLDQSAWAAANPALGEFRSSVELSKWANRADRMPSAENSFRNLYLNQRVNRIATFISPSIWAIGNRNQNPAALAGEVWGGLDLAETTDLCAFVYGGLVNNEWSIWAKFWKAEETVLEHGKRDRVPYKKWADEGLLTLTPGRAVDYEFVAHDIQKICEGLNFVGIAYDRFRFKTLEKKFADLDDPVVLPFVEWGQGYISMAPAVDITEVAFLNEQIAHGGNPIMRMCAANAVTIKDPAGNRKLDKSKSTGRIDGMQALVQMIGLASIPREAVEENIYERRGLVIL